MIERMFSKARVEFRAMAGSDSPGMLQGRAATYGTYSADLGGFVETVRQGAFDKSLRNGDEVVANVNHDPSLILGRTRNKSLLLNSDNRGLAFVVELPPTSTGRDTAALVARGDLSQCSFAFICEDETWGETADPSDPSQRADLRTIVCARLLDVSIVSNPAYSSTSVSAAGVHQSFLGDGTQPLGDVSSLMRAHFPAGLPAEVRSRIERSSPRNPKAAERRRRILEFCL